MRQRITGFVCALALVACTAVTVAPAATASPAAATPVVAAASCGPLWLRVWLVFTQPSYVGYLVGRGACGR